MKNEPLTKEEIQKLGDGYYWVRLVGSEVLFIASRTGPGWVVGGSDDEYYSDSQIIVNSERLIPPKNNNSL